MNSCSDQYGTTKISTPSSNDTIANDCIQNDSTRAKTLELHIQARVAEELKRLQAREDETLKDVQEKLSSEEPSSKSSDDSKSAGNALRNIGRESVQQEIDELKKKLESRKKVKDVKEFDAGVEKARESVISCLRGNDRRPLDCWKEVEEFKKEVRRVEEGWVQKVVG